MIKKYGEFLNESASYRVSSDATEFAKKMSATASAMFSLIEFEDEEFKKYITVIFDSLDHQFIISEKIAITSLSVDVEKISENHKVVTASSVEEAISIAKIMYLFSKSKGEHETFFDSLIKIVQTWENRKKTFDELKPLFVKEVKPYEDDYEVTLDNFVLEYIGMPPHNLASRKFGL